MEILKQIKKWMLQWFWILLVVWLAWVSYAAFTWIAWLAVSSWDTLTAQKWTNLVDAVDDQYSTSETLTNKTWLWQPVYRKVVELTTPSGSTWVDNDVSAFFTWASNCRVAEHIIYRSDGRNTTSTQSNSAWATDIKNDCSIMWIQVPNTVFYSRPIKVVVEYTK